MSILRTLMAMAMAIFAVFGGSGAFASEIGAPCIARGSLVGVADVSPTVSNPATWDCSGLTNEPAGGDWTLKFDLGKSGVDTAADRPTVLYTRLGHFDRLNLAVRDASGEWTYQAKTLGDMQAAVGSPFIYTSLPESRHRPVEVLASFSGNGHGPTLTRAELRTAPPVLSSSDVAALLGLAALIGVLLIPIALDSAFLLVLRQSFLGWHIALSVSFAGVIATRSNMFGLVVDVPADWWRVSLIMTIGLTLSLALMFTRSYIEPGKMAGWIHRLIPFAAVCSLLVSAIHAASFEALRPLGGNFHSAGMALPLAVLAIAMVDAWRRGSRAVKFQLMGWAPMFLATFIQIITHIFPFGVQQDALPIFFIGILTEGIGTALGVADRFIALRRERDRALRNAREMSRLSEHDPLTGLLNRRAVETRFEGLREQGFNTFALLDLDRFKHVNDHFGHQVGDAALIACANAIRGARDRDSIAVRLGGEEFVILLRGNNARHRAEAFRKSIPVRIAADVVGLEAPVTASMGLIELPDSLAENTRFSDLYARADKLLYEAKEQGRNRMVYERLTLFGQVSKRPRKAKAAA